MYNFLILVSTEKHCAKNVCNMLEMNENAYLHVCDC